KGTRQDCRPWILEGWVATVEAILAELQESKRLQAGQNVSCSSLVVDVWDLKATSQAEVKNLEQFVLVDRLDTLAEKQRFDFWIVVQVSNLRNHTQTDRDSWKTQGSAVPSEQIEEVVSGTVV